MSKRLKNKIKYLNILAFSSLSLISTDTYLSQAELSTSEYKLKEVDYSKVANTSSPPAYKIKGSDYFPDDTILYKQAYRNITYYSPKPPSGSIEATDSSLSSKYANWGFWDLSANQKTRENGFFNTNTYYKQVKVNSGGADAYGCDSDDTVRESSKKTISGNTIINVLNITREDDGTYVYFKASEHGISSYNNVARVKYSQVSPIGTEMKVYFEPSKSRNITYKKGNSTENCTDFYDNFKPYSTLGGSGFGRYTGMDTLTPGQTTIPDDITTCGLGGKTGEWRYLGLSSTGNLVINPYFPGDWMSFIGSGDLKHYKWYSDVTSSVFAKRFSIPTKFDKDFSTTKKNILNSVIQSGGPVGLTTDEFMNRVSLLTNPIDESQTFLGVNSANTRYRSFVIAKETNDLYLKSIVIKDGNTIIAEGTRSSKSSAFKLNSSYKGVFYKGKTYTVEVKLANGSNVALQSNILEALVGTTSSYSQLNMSRKLGDVTQIKPAVYLQNKGGITNSENSVSNPITYSLTIPTNYSKTFIDIYGFVSNIHTGIDNLDYTNDTGGIRVLISPEEKSGDLEATSLEVLKGNTVVYKVDRNGNVSNSTGLVPGESYKVRYTATYKGEDIYTYKYDEVNQVWLNDKLKTFTIPLNYTVKRKTGSQITDDTLNKNAYFVNSSGSTQVNMTSNATFTFTTDEFIFEHPYLHSAFSITSTNSQINKTSTNDSVQGTTNNTFDISISNLKILPNTEYIGDGSNDISYNIVYDATLTVPDVAKDSYKTLITNSISINGKLYPTTDLLKPGTTTNISHTLTDVPISSGNTNAEVILNSNRVSYEFDSTSNDVYANNTSTSSAVVKPIANPFNGNPGDKATTPDNTDNNNSVNRGGIANNNCIIPRTKNTFTSTYQINKWSATNYNYTSFTGNKNISFKKYSNNLTSKSTNNSEEFNIKDILFRSKYTKDYNLGSNGWISALNEQSSAIIKSGYGFELKVIVEYKTNAIINNPSWSVGSNSGTFVTNLSSSPNLKHELFVELPGNNTTRSILSATGYSGTKHGLEVKQTKNNKLEDSMHVSEWEYTIKPSKTIGNIATNKIYVPSNLKNGQYKLSIYTSPLSGVSSISLDNKSKYNSLCDRKDIYITIQGTATDDLNSHNTQNR